ncbi:hypothetical protein AVEN_12916-1 [Araneus ventricosus]|uniref:Tc1-like transposase DDE domain-containing protein n=1 Tax=Araneus ventricosus TaxID=182803 RepID=A0A4Y2IX46_ARAVE|nr:hypothetical protein AVEN_12916-1 [Araneus ventricosus]
MVWAGISLGGHTDLHVFHGGTLTGVRYRDEILDPYVRSYAALELPTHSPDLNPIEHLWDYFGRQVAALSPPRSLDELEQGLLRVWSSLPISVSDNLIDSMESRCRQCIQVRGGHIPY